MDKCFNVLLVAPNFIEKWNVVSVLFIVRMTTGKGFVEVQS